MNPNAFWRGVQSPRTMWTWVSIRPGARVAPLTSIRTSAAAASISARLPIFAKTPSSTRTVSASTNARSKSPLMIRPTLIRARLLISVLPPTFGSREVETAYALTHKDTDVLDLGVGQQRFEAQLAAHAAGLIAPEGCFIEQGHVGIDPHTACSELARNPVRPLDVAGPNGGGQAIPGLVRQSDAFFLGAERDNRCHLPGDFFAGDAHVIPDVIEDGRHVEVTLLKRRVIGAAAADSQGGALLQPALDEVFDGLDLIARDHRPHVDRPIHRVSHAQPAGVLCHPSDEFIVNVLLDDDAGARRAHLPGVEEDRRQRSGDRLIEVGVREDEAGGLAAQFKGETLDTIGGQLHDPLAGARLAGE